MVKRNSWTPSTAALAEHTPFCSYAILHLMSLDFSIWRPVIHTTCWFTQTLLLYILSARISYKSHYVVLFWYQTKVSSGVSMNDINLCGNTGDAKNIGCFFFTRFNNSCCHFSVIQNLLRTGLLSCAFQKILLLIFYSMFIF